MQAQSITQHIESGIDTESRLKRLVKGNVRANEPLGCHVSLRCGGNAKVFVTVLDAEDLRITLAFCQREQIPVFIIGFGTNLLVNDDGFDGCVISLAEGLQNWRVNEDYIYAEAGIWGADVVKLSAQLGLTGLENLAGIPGSLGGWLKMNAGAFRHTISKCVSRVKIMDSDGLAGWVSVEGVGFAYRSSPGLNNQIILGTELLLAEDRAEDIKRRIDETIAERYKRGVMTLPSAGSIFRNPEKNFAAKMLDKVGCKDLKHGGARVSANHANIIVTERGVRSADVVWLIREMRRRALDSFGVKLEREIKDLGFGEEI